MERFELFFYAGGGVRIAGPGGASKLNASGAQRFLGTLPLLAKIRGTSPSSVYGLARSLGLDVSNTRKAVAFLERLGLIETELVTVKNRPTKICRLKAAELLVHLELEAAGKPRRRPVVSRRRLLP
jgi:predicted transcriptional regulator